MASEVPSDKNENGMQPDIFCAIGFVTEERYLLEVTHQKVRSCIKNGGTLFIL